MSNSYFNFKQFSINQEKCAFKVGTDGVLLGAWADVVNAINILDIGTGSGLIALMVAQQSSPNAHITAIEPHYNSYLQAVENFKQSKWNNQITAYNLSLQQFCISNTQKFDLIVSNPPYFVNSLKNPDSQKAATRHTDSLSFAELINGVVNLISPNGKFQVILPIVEAQQLISQAQINGLYCNKILEIYPKIGAKPNRQLMSFSFKNTPCHINSLIIETLQRHTYTEEYRTLTKDYYLFCK